MKTDTFYLLAIKTTPEEQKKIEKLLEEYDVFYEEIHSFTLIE